MRGHSLRAVFHYQEGPAWIFESDGRWLYPLLDLLGRFPSPSVLEPPPLKAEVWDRISGRAGALLLVYLRRQILMQVAEVRIVSGLASEGAIEVFEHFGLEAKIESRVDRIACATEADFEGELDPARALERIQERVRIRRRQGTAQA